ncbi:hypothetical protein Pan258_18290 [Symmachiella dynata]|uniref:DUF167 domain-containing protein n=1 Tax=Symmachiella dynata TaxID=2527995 RepID=UPI001188CE2D|nr:DUF167 domain-containing protein [Symmachiella dynata]QDT47792.1 hypothetical protein Pan258_18290 [Symmachiella dynata]
MIDIEPTTDGVLLPVRAQAGARKNGVVGVHDGRLKVAVTQAPEKGKANGAIQKVLAAALGLKKSQVELVVGPTSSQKKFRLTGVTADALRERIAALLAEI